jgi:hypothetical protein
MTYRTQELYAACPLPLWEAEAHNNYPFGITLQIRTEHGKTKWLTITPAEFKEIETILCREE